MPNKDNFFAKKDSIANAIKNDIDYSLKLIAKGCDHEKGIRSSDLTRCPRSFYFKNKLGIPFVVDQYFKYHLIDKWKTIFQYNKKYDIVSENYSCSDIKYNLMGFVDLIIRDISNPRRPIAINIYQVKQDEFENIKEGNIPRKDIVELMANMWMVEIADGILIYENKNTFDFEIYHLMPDAALINGIKDICKNINGIFKKNIIPERPYKAISIECEKCSYGKKCWAGGETNV